MSTLIYDFIEIFLSKNFKQNYNNIANDFLKRINDIKKYNLDEESFFINFKNNVLHG